MPAAVSSVTWNCLRTSPRAYWPTQAGAHRWIRGDWQIAAWMFHRVPCAGGRSANPLSWLSRWKIGDNLRRSLTPVCLFAIVVLGWTWTPLLAVFLDRFGRDPHVRSNRVHCRLVLLAKDRRETLETTSCGRGENLFPVHRLGGRFVVYPALSAHYHLDAIVRALYRLYVSRRLLLQWTTASLHVQIGVRILNRRCMTKDAVLAALASGSNRRLRDHLGYLLRVAR